MIIAPVATPELLQAREEREAHEVAMVGGHHAPEMAEWTEKHEEQDDTSYEFPPHSQNKERGLLNSNKYNKVHKCVKQPNSRRKSHLLAVLLFVLLGSTGPIHHSGATGNKRGCRPNAKDISIA
eukprot:4950160-Pyramimonas_sp.AAC.1